MKAPTRIAQRFTDADVFTRYDTLREVRRYLPPTVELKRVRGVRVITPTAQCHDLPGIRALFGWAERRAADHPLLRQLGGFLIVVLQRRA